MPSTNRIAAPPLVAGVAAVALVLRRYVPALVLELATDIDAVLITQSTYAARFAAFVLVYGALFGVAYWAGRSHDAGDDAVLAAATFAVAVVVALATSVGAVSVTGTSGLLVSAVTTVGTSVAIGVQLTVVAFAGVAARRRQN